MKNECTIATLFFCVFAFARIDYAEESKPVESSSGFKKQFLPLLENHCFGCHGQGKKKPKGDLALNKISRDLIHGKDTEVWKTVLDKLNSGKMPPKKKPRPPAVKLLVAVNWLTEELRKAEEAANAKGSRIVLRRLNRLEYQNTMRDLIGHPFDPTELFSPDTVSHGFDNLGESLVVSPLHVESFVAATERILDKVIDLPEKPPLRQHWRIINSIAAKKPLKKDKNGAWHDGHVGKNRKKIKSGFLKGNVLPNIEIPNGSTPYSMIDLTQNPPRAYEGSWDIRAFGGSRIDEGVTIPKESNAFGFKWFAYEEGMYRVRLHVSSFGPKDWKGSPPKLAISLYPEGTIWREQLLTLNRSEVIQFDLYRDNIPWYIKTNGNRNWGLKLFYSLSNQSDGKGKRVPFGIHVSEIEIEGPRNPVWPPAWHRRIFPVREKGVGDEDYAKKVLKDFMTRAYRRTVSTDELSRMMAIYRKEKSSGKKIKQALRMPLATILSSPSFLCIVDRRDPQSKSQGQARISAYELASRLSYFIWRSMPDDQLFALAKSGELLREEVLMNEIDRMLKDKKSEALVDHFTRQWLGLNKLDKLEVDKKLYPEYDLALRQAMVGEATAFFREILHQDLSMLNFIDSDFLMLNDRMAIHYGIPNVTGKKFRKIQLRPQDHRGGVLTQAAVLTSTSDGFRTFPIKRGVFILEQILADPPPPPPPDVAPIEDVVSLNPNATLRERLEQHRTNPTCMNCHKKIDPLGFALENYDAIGQWRSHEMVVANKKSNKMVSYKPGATIKIHFENAPGNNNDWIAILPAAEEDNRKADKAGLFAGGPTWKHTDGTSTAGKSSQAGITKGNITLTAPTEPGDYEVRLFFAGGYKVESRHKFSVSGTPSEKDTGKVKPPLILDPRNTLKSLVSVAVDAAGKLPDGRAFQNIKDLKKLLLDDKEAFLECMTKKMLVYSLGRPVTFADRKLVKNMVTDLKRKPTIRNLIKSIVMSDTFQSKGKGR